MQFRTKDRRVSGGPSGAHDRRPELASWTGQPALSNACRPRSAFLYGRGDMNRDRLELALERLRPAAWERFEQFANRFLASEFPNLRPVSHSAGDKGRDALLWQERGDDSVLLQYSVTDSWTAKIVETAETITEHFPNASVLIYVTTKLVAAQADAVRKRLRTDFGLFLDVRDRLWFLDGTELTPSREDAAEALAVDVVDPFLASRGVIESKGQALTSFEAQAAFVHLALQWEDDTREKGTSCRFRGSFHRAGRCGQRPPRLSMASAMTACCEW